MDENNQIFFSFKEQNIRWSLRWRSNLSDVRHLVRKKFHLTLHFFSRLHDETKKCNQTFFWSVDIPFKFIQFVFISNWIRSEGTCLVRWEYFSLLESLFILLSDMHGMGDLTTLKSSFFPWGKFSIKTWKEES